MDQFMITEGFSRNYATFDAHFNNETACQAYLLNLR